MYFSSLGVSGWTETPGCPPSYLSSWMQKSGWQRTRGSAWSKGRKPGRGGPERPATEDETDGRESTARNKKIKESDFCDCVTQKQVNSTEWPCWWGCRGSLGRGARNVRHCKIYWPPVTHQRPAIRQTHWTGCSMICQLHTLAIYAFSLSTAEGLDRAEGTAARGILGRKEIWPLKREQLVAPTGLILVGSHCTTTDVPTVAWRANSFSRPFALFAPTPRAVGITLAPVPRGKGCMQLLHQRHVFIAMSMLSFCLLACTSADTEV